MDCSHQVEAYRATENNIPSLQNIVLHYVVKNIENLESLEDFPQTLGEEIFRTCLKEDLFIHQNKCSEAAFCVFLDAYGSEMLSKFMGKRVSRNYIAKFGDFLSRSLRFVTELDMSECSIVADELLAAFGGFRNLTVLDLSGNYLSEEGLRLLLARQKVFGDCFQNLQHLYIRDTNMPSRYLQTLLKFPKLEYLEFSVVSPSSESNISRDSGIFQNVSKCKSGPKNVDDVIRDCDFETCPAMSNCSVKSMGYLAFILKHWMNDRGNSSVVKRDENVKSLDGFYSRPKKSHIFDVKTKNTVNFIHKFVKRKCVHGKKRKLSEIEDEMTKKTSSVSSLGSALLSFYR